MSDSQAEPRILVRVRARQSRGRYRCGKFWPASVVEAQVTEQQFAQLESDPVLVVHRAERRNEAVPTVNEVQPGADKEPELTPWGDVRLERQRQELAALDEERAAEEKADRETADAVELSEYEAKPNDTNKPSKKHRRR